MKGNLDLRSLDLKSFIGGFLVALLVFGAFFLAKPQQEVSVVSTTSYLEIRDALKAKLMEEGKYRCCIKEPCSYCLEEGGCDCIDKIMEGRAPCGECIGEILEGNANPYLSDEQISRALSEVKEEM